MKDEAKWRNVYCLCHLPIDVVVAVVGCEKKKFNCLKREKVRGIMFLCRDLE